METDQQKDIYGFCKKKFLEHNVEELKDPPMTNVFIFIIYNKECVIVIFSNNTFY